MNRVRIDSGKLDTAVSRHSLSLLMPEAATTVSCKISLHEAFGNLKSSHHDATTRAETQHLVESSHGNMSRCETWRLQYLGRKAKKKSTRAFSAHDANDRRKPHAVSATSLGRDEAGTHGATLVRGGVVVNDVPSARHHNVERIVERGGQYAATHSAPAECQSQRNALTYLAGSSCTTRISARWCCPC